MTNPETRGRPAMAKPIRRAVAACRALGLSYWCHSQEPGCVWAVDTAIQAYVLVRVSDRGGLPYAALATEPLGDGGHRMLRRAELVWVAAPDLPADAPIPAVL